MRKGIVFFGFILGLGLLFSSCKKENDGKRIAQNKFVEDPSIIQDQYGRQLILHGLNTSASAKSDPLGSPWITEADVDREAIDFGFNFVRYLIFWDGIEPQKGVFDEAYLDRVQERVEWYTKRGMYVMLDMHQDLYAQKFDGDGAPEWAIRSGNNKPIEIGDDMPWWLKNIDPAIIAAWINFWEYKEHKDLQDHYALMWQKAINRFKDNPYVIGYDLMNEPWGGDLIKSFITREFERVQLTAFYNRLIPKIREVDPDGYIFFEPTPAPVTFGFPSTLMPIRDTRVPSRLVYAPHCYPFDTHEGNGYTQSSKKNLIDWENQRKKEVSPIVHGNIPLMTGEFGLGYWQTGFDTYLKDFNNMSDRNQWHWAYWSYDLYGWSPIDGNRNPTPIRDYIVRAYPRAVAGKIVSFDYNPDTRIFNLKYNNNNDIDKPTEIAVPKFCYPNGFDAIVSGASDYSTSFDEQFQIFKIKSKLNTEITVNIKPK
ncbi:MAG TPA: cellulase family glycosylhydrolase [Chitinophagales bacterium]|nr:cellulase family glycosylhydrolase [Chitinophagales bacterium]HNJ59654.1 cellulase family glycosylhydrolase [Chitinophagales bacterium]